MGRRARPGRNPRWQLIRRYKAANHIQSAVVRKLAARIHGRPEGKTAERSAFASLGWKSNRGFENWRWKLRASSNDLEPAALHSIADTAAQRGGVPQCHRLCRRIREARGLFSIRRTPPCCRQENSA